MRPLAAALCLGNNDIVLTGEPRMKERPIGHLVDALRRGGAKITYPNKIIIHRCVYRAVLLAATLTLMAPFPASSSPHC